MLSGVSVVSQMRNLGQMIVEWLKRFAEWFGQPESDADRQLRELRKVISDRINGRSGGGQGLTIDPDWEYTPEWKARLKAITPTNEEFRANADKLFPPQEWFDEVGP